MRKLTTLALICILMQSCNSQEKDLAKITFTEKYDTFFVDIPNKLDTNYSIIDPSVYNSYKSESEKILYFNGIDLSGYRNTKGGFGTNNIRFEFYKKDQILNFYYVQLYTKDKIGKLIEAINSKVGRPIYIRRLLSKPKNTNPDALLWEDNISFYLLTGATQNQVNFIVFDKNNSTIRKKWISGAFQYYCDYLDYLEEKNKSKKQISYYQYAKIMENEGNDYYIKSYNKP